MSATLDRPDDRDCPACDAATPGEWDETLQHFHCPTCSATWAEANGSGNRGNIMTTDDETTDDGLPLDPVKRAAAVAAQFDDFKAQLAALSTRPDDRRPEDDDAHESTH